MLCIPFGMCVVLCFVCPLNPKHRRLIFRNAPLFLLNGFAYLSVSYLGHWATEKTGNNSFDHLAPWEQITSKPEKH